MSKSLHLRNASEICIPQKEGTGIDRLPGYDMIITDGLVSWLGEPNNTPDLPKDIEIYDAGGKAVLPALVDFHTHLIYSGDRVSDFAARSRGVSYSEIAAAGGGILTTVKATRSATIEELATTLEARLKSRTRYGIATTEVKSGYGLSVTHELNMLEAAKQVRNSGWDLEATLLAAHTVPHDQSKDSYINEILDELIPYVAKHKLARFVDVFVEQNAYTVDDARRIFAKAKEFGLIPRIHADQITPGGGAELAGEVHAASADHLENISEEGLRAMRENNVIGGLLPGAGIFLGDEVRGLGRKLVDAGIEVAVATDANPGSSPLNNLPLAATLATTQMGLTVDEAIRGVTLGAAHALKRPDVGSLLPGCRGNFIVLEHSDSRALVYAFGEPIIRDLIVS
ncbi:MAG: imidazolonepropionase [Myxococcota bacterium]|nr:imidazolonepropionase [Myxococcota bacterium]